MHHQRCIPHRQISNRSLVVQTSAAGKSLVVHELVRQCQAMTNDSSECSLAPAVVSINCMSLPTPQAIFGRILAGIAQATQEAGETTHSFLATC